MGNEAKENLEDSKPQEGEGGNGGEGKENPPEPKTDSKPQEGEGGDPDDNPKDKHGHPGISLGKYERDMKEKDDRIAELEAKVAESAKTEEGRKKLQDEIDKLKQEQADERITYKLELEHCVNVKAAKALLDDYDGDVSKLKADCPYLFEGEKKSGSTGGKPAGAPDASEKRLAEARKASGIKVKE